MVKKDSAAVGRTVAKSEFRKTLVKINRYRSLYFFLLLAVVWYIIFQYIPMYGITLAFKDFSYSEGIFGGDWVGFKYFKTFIFNPSFWNMVLNTVKIAALKLGFGFPTTIIFALMLNEVSHSASKRIMQTISYLPHFVSWVVIITVMNKMLSPYGGILNEIRSYFGYESVYFMGEEKWFYPLVVISNIYKGMGFSTIIYLAALAGVDPQLYEAAAIDGAGHMRRIWHVTIPAILPTIVLQFILQVGGLLSAGFEQIYLLANGSNSHLSTVLDTYGVNVGIKGGKFSLATAVGIFQSIIGFAIVFTTNKISKRVSDISLW